MDANICRESLEKLIAAEADALARLEQVLESEHGVISTNDIDALERTGDARQACFTELARIQDERHSLCRMLDVAQDAQGLERLLSWCDPSLSLQRRWAACADTAQRCRDWNEKNGALVAARLQRVEGMLNVLTGKPAHAPLYNAQGSAQHTRSGRMLTTRV